MVRQPDATMQPTPQDIQLMSKHCVLSFKPQRRLEWRGQDGQNETEQPDHSASLGDSITSSTRIRFSVHTGVADPTDVVRNLMDPVIWREAPLETVLCVVDATTPVAMLNDALLRSQIRASDVVALSKVDLADATDQARVRDAVRAMRPAAVLVDAPNGEIPAALLFLSDVDRAPPTPRELGRPRPAADRFETLSWTSEQPVSLSRLQQAIGRLATKLARAKGLFDTVEQPGRLMVFQFAGGRATLAPGGTPTAGMPRTRIVFIAEIGVLSSTEIDKIMEGCIEAGAK